MNDLTISVLTEDSYDEWNDYINQASEATFFHLAQWQTIFKNVLRHTPHYLIARSNNEVVGVFPLVHVKSKLFGSALISVPFAVYGGIVANNSAVYSALSDYATQLAQQLGVDYVEVRDINSTELDWAEKDLYVTFRKELLPTVDENFKAIPRKQRAVVRKAIDGGLRSEWDDNVDRFYAMYSESVRNLGTPVLSKQYYQSLLETFGEQCSVLTILNGDEPVSSVLSFYFRDQVLPYYGGGPASARACKANDFMYWELMRLSVEQGVKVFDFGRSKNGVGSYRFKKHWGFQPEPLHYKFNLIKANDVPDLSPVNPKYQLAIKMWQKLPVSATQMLGPMIARNLG